MEANFFKSLELVLHHEGGFVDHEDDPGGATNKGITHKTYADFLGRPLEDIYELKNIPDEHVQLIYKDMYWDKICGDDLPTGLDYFIFDWAVNSGPSRASKALQGACAVKADGIIGPKTLLAVQEQRPDDLVEIVANEREEFYRSLRTFETFGKGWLRRNNEARDEALKWLGDLSIK